jgi:phage gp29-like protein
MKLFGFEINRLKSVQNKDEQQPENAQILARITERQLTRQKQDIQKWRNAISIAESKFNPSRVELTRIFNDIVLDAHLSALMQTRSLAILSTEYKFVNPDGSENDDVEDQMHREWFNKYIQYCIDSIFYGFSLIELGDIKNDGFDDIKLIPREYVVPETGIVKTEMYGLSNYGFPFKDEPYSDWNIFIGSNDLGLLNKAAPLVIWKKNVLGAWSIRADLFGMPIRIGKTNIRNNDSRLMMEQMMREMDVATWGVFDKDDEIEFVETASNDAFKIYDEMVNRTNSELSKLILGQTGTTDEKSYSGSAEVHERIAQMYAYADREFVENCVNDKLIPLMVKHGIMPDGIKFEFCENDELTIDQQFKIDAELLKYYNIPAEYITEKYGTPVEMKTGSQIQNVANLYEPFFKKDDCC